MASGVSYLFDELEMLQCPLDDVESRMRWELKYVPLKVSQRLERAKSLFKHLQAIPGPSLCLSSHT